MKKSKKIKELKTRIEHLTQELRAVRSSQIVTRKLANGLEKQLITEHKRMQEMDGEMKMMKEGYKKLLYRSGSTHYVK